MHLHPTLVLLKNFKNTVLYFFLPYWSDFVNINTELANVVCSFTKKILSLRTSHFSRRE